jgi:hypothetical protein
MDGFRESVIMRAKKLTSAKVLVAFGICSLAAIPANADDRDDRDGEGDGSITPCERTARRMANSCFFGVGDELQSTIANCLNIRDGDERESCVEDARVTRREESASCRDVLEARTDACEILGEFRYDPDPLLDTANEFIDPDAIPGTYAPNPYVSLAAGHTYVLRAGEEDEEIVVVHVTPARREIEGVSCRVVSDIVVEVSEANGGVEYEAVEVTDDWFAQDTVGNVYYCGELSRNFEDGLLRNIGGSFEAGQDFAKAGTLILRFPMEGEAHRTEFALGEAEDIVQYVSLAAAPTEEEGGDNSRFPCSIGQGQGACLKTFDFAPIEPGDSEFKYYLPDTGFVLAVAMEDGETTGEREELTCVGDSLDVLDDPSCEIEDPAQLREELCALAPQTFCREEE